jgi:hypothetical protein
MPKPARKLPAKPRRVESGGLPGRVSEIGLSLRRGLAFVEWEHTVELLGRMGRCCHWWLGDAILYGEDRFGEKASQGIEAAEYDPGILAKIVTICRRVEPARRRKELSFSHHIAVAHLAVEEQIRWLARAVAGEEVPNGERRAWSVAQLRAEIRRERVKDVAESADQEAEGVDVAPREELPVIGLGDRIKIDDGANVGIYALSSLKYKRRVGDDEKTFFDFIEADFIKLQTGNREEATAALISSAT